MRFRIYRIINGRTLDQSSGRQKNGFPRTRSCVAPVIQQGCSSLRYAPVRWIRHLAPSIDVAANFIDLAIGRGPVWARGKGTESILAKLASLACLAPDIVTAMVQGRQPAALTSRSMLEAELPLTWADQRRALGFA